MLEEDRVRTKRERERRKRKKVGGRQTDKQGERERGSSWKHRDKERSGVREWRERDQRERKEKRGKLAPSLHLTPADEMQQSALAPAAAAGSHSKAPNRRKKGASAAGQGQQQVRREIDAHERENRRATRASISRSSSKRRRL